jgi:hypothetical protein
LAGITYGEATYLDDGVLGLGVGLAVFAVGCHCCGTMDDELIEKKKKELMVRERLQQYPVRRR